MSAFDVDFFVIGGGSGGVRAARIAAEHGARVAIAEADRWGGTCVIRGCVPKKLLVYAAEVQRTLEDARGQGWTIDAAHHDWASLVVYGVTFQRGLPTVGVFSLPSTRRLRL